MIVLGNRVLVRAVKKEDVLGRDEVDHYEVAYIGSGLDLYEGQVKVGDHVYYQHSTGKVTINEEELLVVPEDELIAII